MKPLNIAIIGCGQIADGHVSEIQKLKNAVVVAVCDTEIILAEQLASRYGIDNYYDSHKEMLEKCGIDVVHICTPPATHLSLAKASLDSGCHIYVEKPLTLTHEETVDLIECAKKANKKMTIGHHSEFDSPSIELRNLLKNGVLGDPVHVESWYGYNMSGAFGKAILASPDHWVHRLPGGLFHNNIDHMLNKILGILDDDQPKLHAFAWRRDAQQQFGDVRDSLYDELRIFIQGKNVSAYGTFSSSVRPVGQYVKVYGTKKIVELDYTARSVIVDNGAVYPSALGRLFSGYQKAWQHFKSSLKNTKTFYNYDYHYFNGMGILIKKFYESILDDAPIPIPTRAMKRISWIMDEIFNQIQGHK
jgi:predicted dehydrogenase